ncbi:MAG: M20 family metallopeptidase [Planctomycetes bacterium]|nr:M20 family metallopeptidase [Planctomycetota bacterium]
MKVPSVIDLTQELVRCATPNPPGNEAPAADIAARYLRTAGVEVTLLPLAVGRNNLLGRVRGSGEKRSLVYCGHFDVVAPGDMPWSHPAFGAEIEAGLMFGRGTADMKGGVASMLAAVARISASGVRLRGDLVFAGTCGEEVDMVGARQLLQWDGWPNTEAIFISEPTNLNLVVAERGVVWLKLAVKGKAAHGSTPQLGRNAILMLGEALRRLNPHSFTHERHPLLGSPTLNVGLVRGGTKINMVPDYSEAQIDYRLVPGQTAEGVVEEIRQVLERYRREQPDFRYEVSVMSTYPPMTTDPGLEIVHHARRVGETLWKRALQPGGATYFTDAAVLAPGTGKPVIILGPGDPAQAHQTDEHVPVHQLEEAEEYYTRLALEWL